MFVIFTLNIYLSHDVISCVCDPVSSEFNLQADPDSPESDLRVGDKQFTHVFRHFLSSKQLFLKREFLLDVPVVTAEICVLKHTATEAEDDE